MARPDQIRVRPSPCAGHATYPDRAEAVRAVRAAVLTEWRREKQMELSRDYLAALRKKYAVELDDSVKAALRSEPSSNVAAR